MLFSVVVVARDAGATLPAALASVLAQTVTDWECVVVSDGSVDRTADLAREALGDRGRVVELSRNVGRGAARRLAVEQARGEYVVVQDADDVSRPHRLEVTRRVLEETGADVVTGQVALLRGRRSRQVWSVPTDHATLRRQLLEGRMPVNHCACALRRDAVLAAGGYDARYRRAQDLHLLLRMAPTARFAGTDEVLVDYRYPWVVGPRRHLESARAHRRAALELGLPAGPEPSLPGWLRTTVGTALREELLPRLRR